MAFENVRPHTVPVTTVADVAALKALPAGSQGDQVYVADQTCFVVYQADSTLAEDQPNGIFVPDSAPPSGRWIYQDQSPVGGGGESGLTLSVAETNDSNPTGLSSAEVVLLDPTYSTPEYFPTTGDMVAHLLLNETSGTAYDNLVSGGADWTLTAGTATQGATGYIDKGINFNDDAGIITAPAETGLTGFDYGVLMCWCYMDAVPGSTRLGALIWKSQGTYDACTFGFAPEQAGANITAYANNVEVDFAYTLPLTTWTHLAVAYDGSEMHLYVDGVFNESKSRPGGALVWTNATANRWTIGQPEGRTDRGFDGTIEDARIYNRVLSADDIAAIYASSAKLTGIESGSLTTRRKTLVNNNASNYVTLVREGASSSSANRFNFPDVPTYIPPKQAQDVIFANGKWRKVGNLWALE